eukprot:403358046
MEQKQINLQEEEKVQFQVNVSKAETKQKRGKKLRVLVCKENTQVIQNGKILSINEPLDQQVQVAQQLEQSMNIESIQSLETSLNDDQPNIDQSNNDQSNEFNEKIKELRMNIRFYEFQRVLSCPQAYKDEFHYFKVQQDVILNDNYYSKFLKEPKYADLLRVGEINQYIARVSIRIDENIKMKENDVIFLRMTPVNEEKFAKYTAEAIIKDIYFAQCQTIVFIDIAKKSYTRKCFIELPCYKEHFYKQEIEYELKKSDTNDGSMKTLESFVSQSTNQINQLIRESIFSGVIKSIPRALESEQTYELSYFIAKKLSPVQREIVQRTLYPGIHAIQGGGGCGKSFTLINIAQSWIENMVGSPKQILICAPSNCAIDLIAERMQENQFLKDKFVRVYSDTREDVFKMTLDNLQPFSLLYKALFYGEEYFFDEDSIYESFKDLGVDRQGIKGVRRDKLNDFFIEKSRVEEMILNEIPIILCTLAGSNEGRLQNKVFHKVIIDEATQAKEYESLRPIMHVETVVLIGDHKQLGPTYQEYNIDGPQSLFERLVMNQQNGYSLLNIQYRSHPAIVAPLNRLFYFNRLFSAYQLGNQAFINFKMPIIFIDTKGCNRGESNYESSWYNQHEVELVHKVFGQMKKIDIQKQQIGVVTPYIGQLNKLKEVLYGQIDTNNIGSIDSWQGRETDYTIISTVRTRNLGFVRDANRLNVALSRARHGMIIIGNSQCLSNDENWLSYITYLDENNAIVSYENFDEVKRRMQLVNVQQLDINQFNQISSRVGRY